LAKLLYYSGWGTISATKPDGNVAEGPGNGGVATKRAVNVAEGAEIGGAATKSATNVAEEG